MQYVCTRNSLLGIDFFGFSPLQFDQWFYCDQSGLTLRVVLPEPQPSIWQGRGAGVCAGSPPANVRQPQGRKGLTPSSVDFRPACAGGLFIFR